MMPHLLESCAARILAILRSFSARLLTRWVWVYCLTGCGGGVGYLSRHGQETPLQVASFHVDVTPPIGSPLAYNRCDGVGMPLSARGVVLSGRGEPILLCAVDWIGISNEGHRRWKETLALAVGTSPDRVSVHTLHQHDAPRCDLSAERLLEERGLGGCPGRGLVEQTLKRVERPRAKHSELRGGNAHGAGRSGCPSGGIQSTHSWARR